MRLSLLRSRIAQFAAVLACILSFSGCGWFKNDSTSPSTTTTETFTGTLTQRGTNVFTFTVGKTGTVTIALTNLGGSSVAVALGTGNPNGSSGCTVTTANLTAVAGATPQITTTLDAGSRCVQISDQGTLTAATPFSITIVHP
jgi:hypothetical protein